MGWIRLCGGGKQQTAGCDADNRNSSTSSTNVFQRHPQMGVFAKSSHPDYLQRRIPWLGWRNLTEVGQNLTQKVRNTTNIQYIPKKNHTTNITQRPLYESYSMTHSLQLVLHIKLLPALQVLPEVTSCWQLDLNFISTSTLLRYLIPSTKVNSLNLQQVRQ